MSKQEIKKFDYRLSQLLFIHSKSPAIPLIQVSEFILLYKLYEFIKS